MAKNIVADLPPDPADLEVGDFWTDTGGTGGNQLYVWQGDYFVSATGSAEREITTADVRTTEDPVAKAAELENQKQVNHFFDSRITACETEVVGGLYHGALK